jgi:hypothetical protein
VIVLSLGAGVQSTTIALLSVDGVLPHVDHAVFADTGWEPADVYEHLDRLTPVLEAAGTVVHRVAAGNLRADALDPSHRYASLPVYLDGPTGPGIGRRQCTNEYKLTPIKARVRELLGAQVDAAGRVGRVKRGRVIDNWVGISADEAGRIRPSDVAYMRRVDPLVELMPTPWSRTACLSYLTKRWPHPVPRSACIGCPYHSNTEWVAMRDTRPAEWADAVAFDAAIRHRVDRPGWTGRLYLHADRVPLDEADIDRPAPADDQLTLWDEPRGCSPFDCRVD